MSERLRLAPRRLVVVGSVLVDILLFVDRLPEPGGVAIARRSIVAAGAGFNLLAGATRLGLPSACAALIGDGPFGDVVRQALEAIKVPVLLPARAEEDTGFDIGLVEADTSRQPTFLGAPGAESGLRLSDLRNIQLRPGDVVYLSGYDLWYPQAGAALAAWIPDIRPECLFAFDPGPLAGEIESARLAVAMDRADILSLTVAEAVALAGTLDPPELAGALARRIPQTGWVVLRAAADGCWVARRGGPGYHVPARPVTPVDTTGAGDAHLAALLARLAAGDDIARAAWWANIAASLAVERAGPSTGPSAEELMKAAAEADPAP
jgi:sugar/nucleoside kinase (ribokinase family)